MRLPVVSSRLSAVIGLLFIRQTAVDPVGPVFESRVRQAVAECSLARFRVSAGAPPVSTIRGLTGGEDGKELYVQFLKDRYDYNITRVNQVYRQDASSFSELLGRDFRQADGASESVRRDDAAFLEMLKSIWTRWVLAARERCGRPETALLRVEGEYLEILIEPKGQKPE